MDLASPALPFVGKWIKNQMPTRQEENEDENDKTSDH